MTRHLTRAGHQRDRLTGVGFAEMIFLNGEICLPIDSVTMIQTQVKPITFAQFLEWKPEGGRYELHNGGIVEMQPTGEHEEVKGFLARKLTVEFDRLNRPYFIPNQALVKPSEKESGYLPDVLILNRPNLGSEPLWQKFSTVTQAASIPLVIEVVSTNWRDDYFAKFGDYEEIGIPEYWIVDYPSSVTLRIQKIIN